MTEIEQLREQRDRMQRQIRRLTVSATKYLQANPASHRVLEVTQRRLAAIEDAIENAERRD